MSDQMPDEVWLERPRWDGWGEYTTKRVENPRVHRVRYIRADLYEHIQLERNVLADTQSCMTCGGTGVDVEYGDYGARLGSDWCDSCEAGKALRELDERAEQAEAERDRLRAALKEIRDMPYDSTTPYTVFDASSRAQEALDHD